MKESHNGEAGIERPDRQQTFDSGIAALAEGRDVELLVA